jgi:AcrR family transcriptional regulator
MNSSSEHANPPVRLDRRAARRQQTKAEIVAAAWDLVQENGLAGLAMRDLGERVGMKAQSIYSYFASKHEIYDAMFHEGYVAFASFTDGLLQNSDAEPLDQVRAMAHQFFHFCTSDPVRYQLLFQRTIPEFVPSDESFAMSIEAYESMTTRLAHLGITDPGAVDLWTAVLTGLTDQQISNDPGGNRWEALIDRAVDMTLHEIAPHLLETSKERDT